MRTETIMKIFIVIGLVMGIGLIYSTAEASGNNNTHIVNQVRGGDAHTTNNQNQYQGQGQNQKAVSSARSASQSAQNTIVQGDDYKKPAAIAPSIGFALAGECLGAGGTGSFAVSSFGFGGGGATLDEQCVKVRNIQTAIEYAGSGMPTEGQRIVVNKAVYNAIMRLDGLREFYAE